MPDKKYFNVYRNVDGVNFMFEGKWEINCPSGMIRSVVVTSNSLFTFFYDEWDRTWILNKIEKPPKQRRQFGFTRRPMMVEWLLFHGRSF